MRYDPSVESFTEVLSKFKKTAKNAYEEKAIEITERFLIAKLPIQPQNEFAMADKHVASTGKIKTFVQQRCQYAELIPNTPTMQVIHLIKSLTIRNDDRGTTTKTNKPDSHKDNREQRKKKE